MMHRDYSAHWDRVNSAARSMQMLRDEQKKVASLGRARGMQMYRNIFEITSEDTANDHENCGIHHSRLGQ